MSNNAEIKKEIDLRLEEITIKIKELMNIADQHNLDFSISILNKDYYCEKSISEDEWLNECHGGNGGAWLSSSDFC